MELKVWVEGIQRVVCGVNEKTTCQDVVYALAHATGKTGRFTLIERWRNSERLLAPGEQPLKVLLKWGDHSNDVQFILQWSPLDSSSNSSGGGKSSTSPVKAGHVPTTGEGLSENSAQFKGGTQSYSPSLKEGTGSQSNSIPQTNGLSSNSGSGSIPSSTSSSKKLPYQGNQLTGQGQRASPGSSTSSSSKQFSHLNGIRSLDGPAPPPQNVGGMKGAPQRLMNSDAIKDFSSSSSSKLGGSSVGGGNSSGKMKELSAPPPYREPPNPIQSYPGKVSPSVSSPSGINSPSLKGLPLPPYREPPPPTMIQQQQQSPSQYLANPYPLRHASNNNSAAGRGGSGSSALSNSHQLSGVSQSFFGSSANSSNSSLVNNSSNSSNNNNNGGVVNNSSGSGVGGGVSSSGVVPSSKDSPRHGHPSHHLPSGMPHDGFPNAYSSNNAGDKSDSSFWHVKDQQLINGDAAPTQNGSASKMSATTPVPSSIDSPNSHYKELVRLVNSQREKLTSQQAELTQYDAEIMFWEGKAKEQQRNMEFITKEISRLEQLSSQNESQVLSLTHLEEESESIRKESEGLKSELNSLRGDLGSCENELDKCRSRLRRLTEELHLAQSTVALRQEEWLHREAATLAEVEKLKKELDLARRETDAVSDLSGSLDKAVHSLDSTLAEKKKQMEQLVSAMKEANLQSLIINPPEETVDGGVHQRSGSTRRMIGSPRQLENAAPTSKNPHGVWV